jgi:hypothetical protein
MHIVTCFAVEGNITRRSPTVRMRSRTEARIFATHTLRCRTQKFVPRYQSDDSGKDFVNGLRDIRGNRYSSTVQAIACELAGPSVASQLLTLPRPTSDLRRPRWGHRYGHAERTVRFSKTACCCDNQCVRAEADLVCIDGGAAG